MPTVTDQRTLGWFWCHDRIIDAYGSKIGPIGIAVYVCLTRHADKAGESFPAKVTIAAEIGVSKRAVDEAISRLVGLKLITVTQRKAAPGDHDSNLYTLLEPPRFIVSKPVEIAAGVSASPSLDSPLTGFPSGAGGALPVVQVVHHPPAGSAPGGAGGALPPWRGEQRTDLQDDLPAPPEMPNFLAGTTSANPWDRLKGYMRLQLPRATYETWLRDTVLVAATENEYTVRVQDLNARDWLNHRLAAKIERNLGDIAGRPITVKYITAQEVAQ